MSGMTYEKSGVSQALGDSVSEIMANACRMTYENPTLGSVYFDGTDALYRPPDMKNREMSSDTDGVGTKIGVAERVGDHFTIFFDLIAMLADDGSRKGGIPVYADNILDWSHPSRRIAGQLARGMIAACKRARIAMLSGENAELGERIQGYGKNSYNLGGSVTWIRENGEAITGKNVIPGDKVLAYREPNSFRSNGYTLLRKLAEKYLGRDWHKKRFGRRTWGRVALEPSTIYTPAWVDTFQSQNVKFIAHITGGGIPGKFGEALEKACGYGADLDKLWEPCDAMLEFQEIGASKGDKVTDRTAYKTWNMGNGGLAVVEDPEKAIRIASKHGIEAGECGVIRENPGVTIVSRGRWRRGKTIDF